MAPVEIKDLVTEQMSGVILLPVEEGEVPEGEIVASFEDEHDISLAPVILSNDEENKDILTSDSCQVVQVKVDLQDTSLYQEDQGSKGEIVAVAALGNEDSSLEKDISLAPVILLNDEDGAFEDHKDILASESCHVVQVDLQDGTTSLLHDYKDEENLKSDPTLEEV